MYFSIQIIAQGRIPSWQNTKLSDHMVNMSLFWAFTVKCIQHSPIIKRSKFCCQGLSSSQSRPTSTYDYVLLGLWGFFNNCPNQISIYALTTTHSTRAELLQDVCNKCLLGLRLRSLLHCAKESLTHHCHHYHDWFIHHCHCLTTVKWSMPLSSSSSVNHIKSLFIPSVCSCPL